MSGSASRHGTEPARQRHDHTKSPRLHSAQQGAGRATGAACAITIAFMLESLLLFLVARQKLGFHIFVFGNPRV